MWSCSDVTQKSSWFEVFGFYQVHGKSLGWNYNSHLPCGRQWQFVVSIEFYLRSQLFADHYTESVSPRLPLERRRPCAGLFAHSFIYAIQISTPLLFIWDANKLVQGCCRGTDREKERERERASSAFNASLLHFCAGKLYHTPTLCCHDIKC